MATRSKNAVIKDLKSVTYINEEGKEVSIPESEINRFVLISNLQMKKGFNKEGFIDKMAAGYLMDSETVRRFLVVNGLNQMKKMEDVAEEIRVRVVIKKAAFSEDEVATMKVICDVAKAFNEMSESIIKIAGARTNRTKSLPALHLPDGVAPQTAPGFYSQNKTDIHVHVDGKNGEKPAVNVEEAPVA